MMNLIYTGMNGHSFVIICGFSNEPLVAVEGNAILANNPQWLHDFVEAGTMAVPWARLVARVLEFSCYVNYEEGMNTLYEIKRGQPEVMDRFLSESSRLLEYQDALEGFGIPWEQITRCRNVLLTTEIPERKKRKPQPAREGYVYLLQSDSGHWKIGRALDPENRLQTFTVKLPFEVEYKHLIPCKDYIAAEKDLHKRYAHRRTDGEWFALTEEDVAAICNIEAM
ncbi:MAG: GIY-YIG nuclease family protein [Chloroflexota bacterium]